MKHRSLPASAAFILFLCALLLYWVGGQAVTAKRFVSGAYPGFTLLPFPSRLPLSSPLVFFHLGPSPIQLCYPFLYLHSPTVIPQSATAQEPPLPPRPVLTHSQVPCLSMSLASKHEPHWFSTASPHRWVSALFPFCHKGRVGLSKPIQDSKFTSFCIFVSI